MADIFSRASNQLGGSFAADSALIVFSGGSLAGGGATIVGPSGGVGLLTQQLQVSYQQQISRLYEVGTNFTYLVAGRTMGNMSMGRILGPRPVQQQFYLNYGNVCNAALNNLTLQMETGCPTGPATGSQGGLGMFHFDVKSLVLTSFGVSVAAQDMIINEQVTAMFCSLEMTAT
jgi:hypothetical protein